MKHWCKNHPEEAKSFIVQPNSTLEAWDILTYNQFFGFETDEEWDMSRQDFVQKYVEGMHASRKRNQAKLGETFGIPGHQ